MPPLMSLIFTATALLVDRLTHTRPDLHSAQLFLDEERQITVRLFAPTLTDEAQIDLVFTESRDARVLGEALVTLARALETARPRMRLGHR